MAQSFAEKYLQASDKIVEILQRETEAGGLLEGMLPAKRIYWGSPQKNKTDIKLGERSIYCIPGSAEFEENTVASYDVTITFHILVAGKFGDIDKSLRETLELGGKVVDVFAKYSNETLDGVIRILHNPDGDTFEFNPDYVLDQSGGVNSYFQFVELVIYGDLILDVSGA